MFMWTLYFAFFSSYHFTIIRNYMNVILARKPSNSGC